MRLNPLLQRIVSKPDVAKAVTSADGVRVAYEVRGTGTPALVFIHGWSCDRSYWAGQLETFSREFQVVAIDLAGHGESGFGRQPWTIGAFQRTRESAPLNSDV